MARFLIGTIPAVGHVNPALPIARKLVERGHEVWWYTGEEFQSNVEATGARYVPIVNAFDPSDPKKMPESVLEKRKTLQGIAKVKFEFKHFIVDGAVGQVKDYTDILRQFPADVLLSDFAFLGASWVHEKGGPPCQKSFFDAVVSPYLYLQGTVPAFEYPRSDLPRQVHFVGPLLSAPPADFTPPTWWDDLQGDRPVILVTQGTVATDLDELIVPTLQALADEDVLVVATTGGQPIESITLAQYPANVRIKPFIPYSRLLPQVDVMVTNGGYNGVQMALANGVPLVVAGQTEDKPEVCARVQWSGVGINLKTNKPTPTQIRDAVKQIRHISHYRQKAQHFQAEIARYDAPTLSATLLEQLAATQQPVT